MGDAPTELSNGTADLGVMFSPRVTDDIALTPLAEASIIALVREDDPLALRGTIGLADRQALTAAARRALGCG